MKKQHMMKEHMKSGVWKSKAFHKLGRAALYVTLAAVGFVFIYPILVMLSDSLKDVYDLSNGMVNWIPSKLAISNYTTAFKVLGGWKVILTSMIIIPVFAAVQTLSSAIIAYGFAKYDFWGKKLFFVLMLATFIMPAQVTFLPKYVLFNQYSILGTIFPVLIPSMLGQGIKSAIFILLYYQFFRMSPKVLDEAAAIDGAGHFKIFWGINMKMATPATVVVFIFSFVWNWNETTLSSSYFGKKLVTLPMALERFKSIYADMFPAELNPTNTANEGIIMAGTLITIIPLIIAYLFVERKLVESIDRSGITGE